MEPLKALQGQERRAKPEQGVHQINEHLPLNWRRKNFHLKSGPYR